MKRKYMLTAALVSAASLALAAEAAKEIALPEALPDIVDWLLASKTASVVKYASVITMVTQVVKLAWTLFGSKIPEKLTGGVVGLVGLATLADQIVAKGAVSGGDWSALAVSVVSTVLAFFGYKVLFSPTARVQR